MVNPILVITTILATTAHAYKWDRCSGVQKCVASGPPPIYGDYTDFKYDSSNGYWYSKQIDGLYINPDGYYEPNGNGHVLQVWNKPGNTLSRWRAPGKTACCLPDDVGTNIQGVSAQGYQ
ncbi:hypothetical protein IWW34DRAFT_779253 [Fusarium oxysporum f. sp. albedinis]|nr:hypothetical protein FOMA001_g5856 [Fusarium oxysporum f. sp. matthiolae]KAI3587214.1 hypothetical protein IWW34DRAFT_779253 [Fusarium oxysporum f. sp. albedinis]KAJ0119889.1 Uncharacterized protein HZ326_31760 [Fusarium oxysporum f. sp. albedinis]KAK2484327.1 hypothetical protein H9L39_06119 [Fusarium oxysporum f. sp. albedinis]